MKILFIGQLGISTTTKQANGREARVLALATLLSRAKHKITVIATPAFCPPHIKKWGQIEIRHIPSFHPEKPGGWLYELLSLITVWKLQPDVVHISSFKAAVLTRLGVLLSPQTTFVWTVDFLPSDQPFFTILALRIARRVMDVITSPTRVIQYRLLTEFGVKTTYIPDGYTENTLYPIPCSHFDLRKQQYAITEVKNVDSLAFLARVYQQTKSRKKLLVFIPAKTAAFTRIAKKFSFLRLMEEPTPRVKYSLISQAATAVMIEEGPLDFILHVMHSGIATVAVNYSLNQEVFGTTARFIERGDSESLGQILTAFLFYPLQRETFEKKAQKRAQGHFTWERIVEEYMTVYHYPLVRKVPVDSIQRIIVGQSLA